MGHSDSHCDRRYQYHEKEISYPTQGALREALHAVAPEKVLFIEVLIVLLLKIFPANPAEGFSASMTLHVITAIWLVDPNSAVGAA